MGTQNILAMVVAIIVFGAVLIMEIRMMRQRHDSKYTLKRIAKYVQGIVGMFFAVGITILGVTCIAAYSKYLVANELSGHFYDMGAITIAFLTIVCMLISAFCSFKYSFWKLTPEEYEWEKTYLAQQKQSWKLWVEKQPKPLKWLLKH